MKSLIITFYLTIALAAVLVAGLGFYAERTITGLSSRTAQVLRENYDSVAYMDTILRVLAEQDRAVLKRLVDLADDVANTSGSTASLEAEITQLNAVLDATFKQAQGNITLPGEGEGVAQLATALTSYRAALTDMMPRFSAMQPSVIPQMYREYETTVLPKLQNTRQAAEALRKMNQDWMEIAARRQLTLGPRLLVIGTTLALVLLIGFGIQLGRRLQRQLYELQALRTHFVAIASHELRTPLTSLRMGLDLLAKETLGPLTPEQLNIAQANLEDCDRLLALARQLLDVTKIQTGQLDIHKTTVRLAALVADAVSTLRSQMQEKMVTIDLDLASPDQLEIQADPIKTTWVITNLLSNALRYSPQGSSIKISATVKGHDVYLSVSDNGPGIPPDIAQNVFKPYYQGTTSSPNKLRGAAGLGLTIAQEIVAAHSGRIWVEPKPFLNTGTTITFTLPRAGES